MIKPPADSDDRRNSLEPRSSSSSSSSWMNCAGLTMLVLSLVLSVAALWIPWQRFGELEGEIHQMEARYEEMMKMINSTREEDITFQQSLIKSPELLKSLDSASQESDELLVTFQTLQTHSSHLFSRKQFSRKFPRTKKLWRRFQHLIENWRRNFKSKFRSSTNKRKSGTTIEWRPGRFLSKLS